jgi:CheY-like chemotaxis protein
VGRLAGGVAHDFSNVLAVVLGYSDLLLRDVQPGDVRMRECVNGITEAAHRAVGVTRQLLTLSRKKLLRPEVLAPNKVVADLERLLSRAIGERITLQTTLGEGLWPVVADSDQLAQVLLNLAVNARDAMPDGGPLEIATANVELAEPATDVGLAPGRYVTLAVKDGGCGMTEEVRARIFEPFFTTKETGTGLGLATVYGIVRQAGGAIRVESQPGRGSQFTVFLPAAEEQVARIVLPVAPAAPRGRGETILLAEDDDSLRVVLGRVLTGAGYSVVSGRNGVEALDAARAKEGKVHLLLSDLVMPKMTGAELADALTREQPQVKVLFMTGHIEDGTALERIGTGLADLIQKPFTNEALLGAIRRLLGPARATAA